MAALYHAHSCRLLYEDLDPDQSTAAICMMYERAEGELVAPMIDSKQAQ
jgi:hypothetical protein